MPLTAYTTLLDEVIPECPGVETAMALYHVKSAARDLYERTLLSREILAPINVVLNTSDYTVASAEPNDFEVVKVLEVSFIGTGTRPTLLEPRTPAQLTQDMPGWNTESGRVCFYTQPSTNVVRLAYKPDANYDNALYVTIARAPKATGAGLEAEMATRFGGLIAAGAKSKLMRMGKKPWSNLQLAQLYAREFDLEVAAAGAWAAKSFGRAPLRTRPVA